MNSKFLIASVALACCAVTAAVVVRSTVFSEEPAAKPTAVAGDPAKNILALELFGTWKVDSTVTSTYQTFAGGAKPERLKVSKLNFIKNDGSAKRVTEALQAAAEQRLKDPKRAADAADLLRYWAVGRFEFSSEGKKFTGDFVLLSTQGVPNVMLLIDGKMGLGETVYLQLARDRDGDKDILFVGGDTMAERYNAFVREPAVEKPADPVKKAEGTPSKTDSAPAK